MLLCRFEPETFVLVELESMKNKTHHYIAQVVHNIILQFLLLITGFCCLHRGILFVNKTVFYIVLAWVTLSDEMSAVDKLYISDSNFPVVLRSVS